MAPAAFFSQREHFAVVGSTNDVVRTWLADGVGEVCLAVADEQAAGRGRGGRTWQAPAGAALLLSLGFRPTWLAPDRTWRLAAAVALAMTEAAEEVAGLRAGTIRLKWPNDLVVEAGGVRKLAGLLGETDGLGTGDPRAVVGIGINADWPAVSFPPALAEAMTSLREVGGGRPIDADALLARFLERIEGRIEALREGRFDAVAWADRQLTTGREIRLDRPGGAADLVVATGVDPDTGALLVVDPEQPDAARPVHAGEIVHVRTIDAVAGQV